MDKIRAAEILTNLVNLIDNYKSESQTTRDTCEAIKMAIASLREDSNSPVVTQNDVITKMSVDERASFLVDMEVTLWNALCKSLKMSEDFLVNTGSEESKKGFVEWLNRPARASKLTDDGTEECTEVKQFGESEHLQ